MLRRRSSKFASLEAAGCEVIRVAVPDDEAAAVLPKIKAAMTVPLIADIHFDHRLALKAAEIVDCVRINPGNIGAWWKVEEVIKAVNERGIPLRVGVNGGSLERPLLDKYGWPSPEALAESALNAVHALEDVGFTNMKVSLKASDVHHAIDAYWLFAHQSDYPLHIGITEAGTAMTGAVKSAMGLGYLLSQGIGDTLARVARCRSGRRSEGGVRDLEVARTAPSRDQCHRLSDLRPCRDRRGEVGQRIGKEAGPYQDARSMCRSSAVS